MQHSKDAIAAWSNAELARRAVVTLADATRGLGVKLLAIKGVHIAWCVAPTPVHRRMADADVLVVEGSFAAVIERLRDDARFEIWADNWSTKCLRVLPCRGASLDLHRLALPPFWGNMKRSSLLRRATHCAAFPDTILVPDLLDAVALALANFVKDGCGAIVTSSGPLDVDLLLPRVSPVELAVRLQEHGLRRVGIVGFTAMEQRGQASVSRHLQALSPNEREHQWAKHAIASMNTLAPHCPYGATMVGRAIGDGPVEIASSVAYGVVRGGRDLARDLLVRTGARIA